MLLKRDELENAIKEKIPQLDSILAMVEAHLQKATGPELEGLLTLTDEKLFFAYTLSLEEPKVLELDKKTFSIVSYQEDIWGTSIKFKCAEEVGEFRRIAPSDFKMLLGQLGRKLEAQLTSPLTSSISEQGEIIPSNQTLITDTRPLETKVEITTEGKCYLHPDKDELTKCDECLNPICSDCINPHRFKTYCPLCFEKVKKHEKNKEDKLAYITSSYTQTSAEPNRVKVEIKSEGKIPFQSPKITVKEARSPALAFLLSFIPGFGQFYNKQTAKGVLVLLTSPLVIPWIWGFVDAVKEARKHNQSLGITCQPAGCFALLLIVFPLLFVFLLSIGFVETHKEMERRIKSQEAELANLNGFIPIPELEQKREKIKEILQRIYEAQMEYFKINKEFMSEIPEKNLENNDSGYRLEIFMLGGEGKKDFRVIAWAQVGEKRKLDLWSVGSGGFIAHEYSVER